MTCTCLYPLPTACAGETLPRSVQRNTTRACRLFATVADASPKRARRHLKQGARALRRAVAKVSRAQLRGLSPECASALAAEYGEAGDRANALASSITP